MRGMRHAAAGTQGKARSARHGKQAPRTHAADAWCRARTQLEWPLAATSPLPSVNRADDPTLNPGVADGTPLYADCVRW